MRWISRLAATIAVLAPVASMAAIVSYGALSRDTATFIIEDSFNHRQWLGWDALAGLSHAQTVALTAPGEAYEGWVLAGIGDAQRFADALLGTPNACSTATEPDETCGNAAGLGALLGPNGLPRYDFAWFLSDDGNFGDVGLLTYDDASGRFNKWNEWGGLPDADAFGVLEDGVAWLMYRPYAVSEPPVVALIGLGLLLAGLGGARRRVAGPRSASAAAR